MPKTADTAMLERLLIAHNTRDERLFAETVGTMAFDAERGGDTAAAMRIRKAYDTNRPKMDVVTRTPETDVDIWDSLEVPKAAPKDKDSHLDLYELLTPTVSFDDVILPENQKRIIDQVVMEQRNARKLLDHNLTPINRVLLCGPPGCGKTMTAFAILFLDELDAIDKKRDDIHELGELKRVVISLLQNFDSLPPHVLLMSATNHDHLLDPAIWRRFNATVTLQLPETEQRQRIIRRNLDRYEVDAPLDVERLARVTAGASGALLEQLIITSAKQYYLEGELTTKDVMDSYMNQLTQFNQDGAAVRKAMADMNSYGVEAADIAAALGVSEESVTEQIRFYDEEERATQVVTTRGIFDELI